MDLTCKCCDVVFHVLRVNHSSINRNIALREILLEKTGKSIIRPTDVFCVECYGDIIKNPDVYVFKCKLGLI